MSSLPAKLYSIFICVLILLCLFSVNGKNLLEVSSIDNKPYIVDNDIIKVSFNLKEEVSSGYTFALTPSHSDIVSITDKHCKSESGDEVLVIKKRDGYYSLTTVKKMSNIQCSFNIRAFFVVNNPTYKLSLTSSLFTPLIVDWSADMYEGDLDVKVMPIGDGRGLLAVTSKLTLKLNTKSKLISKRYIPLLFSFGIKSEIINLSYFHDYVETNMLGAFFSNCINPQGQGDPLIQFHVLRNTPQGLSNSDPIFEVYVLAEIMNTTYTQSVNTIECEANIRHFTSLSVQVEIVSETAANLVFSENYIPPVGEIVNTDTGGYQTSSIAEHNMMANEVKNTTILSDLFSKITDINNDDFDFFLSQRKQNKKHVDQMKLNDHKPQSFKTEPFSNDKFGSLNLESEANNISQLSHYAGDFGRLYMHPYYEELYPKDPSFIPVKGQVIGKDLLFHFYLILGDGYPSCILLRGLRNTPFESMYLMNNFQYINNSPFPGSYDETTDEWKIGLDMTEEPLTSFSLLLYSTSVIDHSSVKWADCSVSGNSDEFKNIEYMYDNSNPPIDDLPPTKIRVHTPSEMTSFSPITVELESIPIPVETTFDLKIKTPYKIADNAPYNLKMNPICIAYNTTDKALIETNPDQYFKSYVDISFSLSTYGELSADITPSVYRELVICKLFSQLVNYDSNLDINEFNGINAYVSFADIQIPQNPDSELFHLIPNPIPLPLPMVQTSSLVSINNTSQSIASTSTFATTDTSDTEASFTVKKGHSANSAYYMILKNVPVGFYKEENSDDILFKLEFKGHERRVLNYILMYSENTGVVDSFKEDVDQNYMVNKIDIIIKNHPQVVLAYNNGDSNAIVDFTLYVTNSNVNMYKDLSDKQLTLSFVDNNSIVFDLSTRFPTFSPQVVTVERIHGKGAYITTRDELMNRYLANPDEVDSTTIKVHIKTTTAITRIILAVTDIDASLDYFFQDFITDFSITTSFSPEVDVFKTKMFAFPGFVLVHVLSQVEEYEEEVEIIVSLTSLINIPYLRTVVHFEKKVDFKEDYDGVGGVAYALSVPGVLSTNTMIDTSNIRIKVPEIPYFAESDITLSNIWSDYYYPGLSTESNNFNIVGSNKTINNGKDIELNGKYSYLVYHIPTHSLVDMTIVVDDLINMPNRVSQTFTLPVYIPDMSLVIDIVRVNNIGNLDTDMTISPNSDHLVFGFIGRVFSPKTKLIINTHQVPVSINKCTQDGFQSTITIFDSKSTTPYVMITKDISGVDRFSYQNFTVFCEFTHLSTAELREGRYTGVITVTLESLTLGKSTVTSVTQGYTVTVSGTENESKKDSVVIDTQVTIRDTPPSGLTPDELDKIKNIYQNSKNTVKGKGDNEEVSVSNTVTYPVGGGKYDTDVDITISPSDNDSDLNLSLNDVKDINDQFMLDIQGVKDSWDVSVSQPTYGVEVGECKNKCGVGCRLCGIEKSCKVDGDCLSHYCHPDTHTCDVLHIKEGDDNIDDNDNDNLASYASTSSSHILSLLAFICLTLLVY